MNDTRNERVFERVAEVQFKNLHTDLEELKARVRGLEERIARGVMLLVANLAGVVVMLAREVVGR